MNELLHISISMPYALSNHQRIEHKVEKTNLTISRNVSIGYESLQQIFNKEPDEIVSELLCKNSGYSILLTNKNNDFTIDSILLIFKCLAKSCKSICNKENMVKLLLQTFCKPFTNMLITCLFQMMQLEKQLIKEFFANFFEVCSFFQNLEPNKFLYLCEDIINAAVLILQCDHNFEIEAGMCNELKTNANFIKSTINRKERNYIFPITRNDLEIEPPEDYRKLSVLPTSAEIAADYVPFLRKNIIKGNYKDANQYLDIQFRLLREDFIRPLREGLAYFRSNNKNKQFNKNLRIYQKVKVDKSELVQDVVVYYLKLNLPQHLLVENSKRFMIGNLLCFSNDYFQTMLFGYVYSRNIVQFKKGLIGVIFESQSIDFNVFYDMAESKAYFVAYKHVLEALQNIRRFELPLPHYLLDASNDLHQPSYLSCSMKYDFRVIRNFNLMKKIYRRNNGSAQFLPTSCYEPQKDFFPELSNIVVAQPINLWPSEDLLLLDESQRKALHGALTRQLAIIQGPPGTGKTFLGLKITQLLLHNSDKWNRGEQSPILVVSYTNHALDQFLEGMVQFTNNIVRVGARSKSCVLSDFTISSLVYQARQNKLIPQSMRHNHTDLYSEVQNLEEHLEKLQGELKELKEPHGIFSYQTLHSVIPVEFSIFLQSVGIENWLLGFGLEGFHHFDFLSQDWTFLTDSLSSCVKKLFSLQTDFESLNLKDCDDLLKNSKMVAAQNKIGLGLINQNSKYPCDQYDSNCDHLYDSTISYTRKQIINLTPYLHDEQYSDDMELYYNHYFLTKKLQMMLLFMNHSKVFANHSLKQPKYINESVNILQLSIPERWWYYNSWIDLRIKQLEELLVPKARTDYQKKYKDLMYVKDQEFLFVMKNSDVVGMTTTGAAKNNKFIQALNPKIVIIEEAAEILESHIVTSLTTNCEHLILIGDHQQLRPSTTVYDLAIKYKLETSLFERMINNGVRFDTLKFQHRMRPSISRVLVSNIYCTLKDDVSVHDRENIKGLSKNIYFIDHQVLEDKSFDDNSSHRNSYEATLLMNLCKYLLLQGYDYKKITILTPYSGQFFLLREVQRKHEICHKVQICVVDSFQGEENDIILLSLVRGNNEGNIGFLQIENRVCVALSRAKNGFYITGNMNQLSSKCELWRKIKKTLSDEKCIGPSIQLKCENHPSERVYVSNEQQFLQNSPEGGCSRQCSYRFEMCGHSCPRKCHILDKEHTNFKCMEPCLRKLCTVEKHQCPKRCWEICGPCSQLVDKVLPCGHIHRLACHIKPSIYHCTIEVERKIPECQHINKMPCHVKVTDFICPYLCDARLDCGHKCILLCHQKNDPLHNKYICREKCTLPNENCSMNHSCIKLCYEKCGLCIFLVDKILSCGHIKNNVLCHIKPENLKCDSICNKLMQCGHHCKRECLNPCGGCQVIVEKLIPECGHLVKMPCGVMPTRVDCNKSCLLKLTCGHLCEAKCGDPCTTKCKDLVPFFHFCPQGHQIKVPCNLFNEVTVEESWLLCSEDCNQKLVCGHFCKGKCGNCLSGRVHMPCLEPCKRILVCGHICKSTCSFDCPPCNNACEMKCEHNRCKKKCSIPCIPCQEGCLWKCPHKVCTERCGKICLRDPCIEPCNWILKCGHYCIGFCGDPCPPLCRVCDCNKLKELPHASLDGLKDSRYVLLEDCKHVVEALSLEKWLNMENKQIGMKRCPSCGNSIYNSRRYSHIIKKACEDIERINFKYFNHIKSSEILKEITSILLTCKGHIRRFYNDYRRALLRSIGVISSTESQKVQRYSTSQYSVALFKSKVLSKAANILFNFHEQNLISVKELSVVPKLLDVLIQQVLSIQERVPTVLVEEVANELQRIEILFPIYRLRNQKERRPNQALSLIYCQIQQLMVATNKFDVVLEEKVINLLKESGKILGAPYNIVSSRLVIRRALKLQFGCWFKCPKNHIYCITECDTKNESHFCPECGPPIGVSEQQLLNDYYLLSEMEEESTCSES